MIIKYLFVLACLFLPQYVVFPALKKLDILRFSIDKVGKPQCGTFYSLASNFNS